jgi:hypothetical protein
MKVFDKILMNNNNQEIKGIVEQLQRLQIKQATLLTRLERVSAAQAFAVAAPAARVPAVEDTGSATSSATREPRPPPTAPRDFDIGDRVRVINPGPGQNPLGIIVKIGPAQIHIRAQNGNEIRRIAKNLIRLD